MLLGNESINFYKNLYSSSHFLITFVYIFFFVHSIYYLYFFCLDVFFLHKMYNDWITVFSAGSFNPKLSTDIVFDNIDGPDASRKSYSSIYLTSKYSAEQSSTLDENNDASNYNAGD